MKNRFYIAAACVLTLFLACSCGLFKSAPGGRESAVSEKWDRAFARESGWTGGDVAASFMIPGGRVLWVFGDSFVGEVEDGRRVRSTLVNNSIAVHAHDPGRPGEAPAPGAVRFYRGPDDDSGKPTAWVRPRTRAGPAEAAAWYWPTGGGAVLSGPDGDFRLALFLILLEKKLGEDSLWAFEVAGNALAMVDNVEDPADRWRARVIEMPFRETGGADDVSGPEIEWGLAAFPADGAPGLVYVYGTETADAGRRDLVLARAPTVKIEDFDAWEFYAGGVKWSETISDAKPIVEDAASELSVDRISGRCGGVHYVMVYSEPVFGDRILVRVSASPEGPWSAAAPIYRVLEVQSNDTFFTYAAKAHAGLSEPGTLLISYVVNSHDFFELVNNASIYRPRFITVSLSGLSLP